MQIDPDNIPSLAVPEERDACLYEIWYDATMMEAASRNNRRAVDANPHPAGSLERLVFALAWEASRQSFAWEASLAGQAEEAVEEQPKWERREAIGFNEHVARVKRRVDALADLYGIPLAPKRVLVPHRQMVADAVCEMLRVPHPTGEERAYEPLWGDWDDADANALLAMAREHPEGSPERERFARMAYRMASAPVLKPTQEHAG